jgi:D-3-phosphoglycerate dehydrogenase
MKCLIIDPMYPGIEALLQKFGLQADYLPDLTPAEVIKKIANYQGLILRSKMKIDINFLEQAPSLKFIARAGAGVDQIDEAYLKKRKIQLFNAPEGNRDAVGEHAVGMILTLFNKIHTADIEIRQKLWRREANRGIEIMGRTVGIIGYGNMGKAFAKRLSGFGCTTLAYDINPEITSDEHAEIVPLNNLFENVDILSLHIPLTPLSKNMVDKTFLDSFKKPFYFVNTARGPVASFESVRYGIEKGIILGACLDVLENEKLETLTESQKIDFDFLCQQTNILFSPHVGGWTHESYKRMNEVIAGKIKETYFS